MDKNIKSPENNLDKISRVIKNYQSMAVHIEAFKRVAGIIGGNSCSTETKLAHDIEKGILNPQNEIYLNPISAIEVPIVSKNVTEPYIQAQRQNSAPTMTRCYARPEDLQNEQNIKGSNLTEMNIARFPAMYTFEELFSDTSIIEPCIHVLRLTDPPTINDGCQFIGKIKAIFVTWFKALRKNQFLSKTIPNDNMLAILFNQKFTNLDFKAGMFRSEKMKSADKHASFFDSEFKRIKELK